MTAFAGTERFRLLERLGEGGMGVVYRAFDQERGLEVALKTLHSLDAGAIYRMKREFRALADIHHENLVTLHELVFEGGAWFFTMERVVGTDFLSAVRVPEEEATERELGLATTTPAAPRLEVEAGLAAALAERTVARPLGRAPRVDEALLRALLPQLAGGVSALHARGRFHRDLKPSNVLVTPEGRLVVLDFGLVTMMAEESADPERLSRHVVGTVGYMSPEQGAGLSVGAASDWYSVGVMLFEALTGQRPFSGRPMDVLLAKSSLSAPRAASLAPWAPPDLAQLADLLLARDPRRRPSGEQLRRQLGVGADPGSAGARAAQGPTGGLEVIAEGSERLFGREAELAALDGAYARAKEGRTVIALLSGGSGMGKSALLRHFLDRLGAREAPLVLSGRCYERESVPYKGVDAVVDALTRHLLRVPAEDAAALLPAGTLALARIFPVLWRVRAIREQAERELESFDAQEHRRLAFRALRDLLCALAVRRPLVLALDDLQWTDLDSAALLRELVRVPEAPPMLLLAAYRAGDRASSAPLAAALQALESSRAQQVSLELLPLAAPDAEGLVNRLLPEGPAARRQAITREAKGSPLLLQELVRHARSAEPQALTLSAALAERLRRLPPASARLVELLAVAGRPVREALLLRASEAGAEGVSALVMLTKEHLARTRLVGEQQSVELYHDRLREAALDALTAEQVRAVHLRLAQELLREAEPDAEALAGHLFAAGEEARAMEHALAAARTAKVQLAFDRSASLFRAVLGAMRPEDPRRFALWRELGDALAFAGRGKEAAQAYQAGAERAPEPAQAQALLRMAAEQLLRSGHVDEGLSILEGVLSSAGLSLAKTPRRAVLSLLFRRVQVRLRGRRYARREESEVPREELAHIDLLWSVAMGLAMVDTARGSDFQARHLLLALRSGEQRRLARALAMEACYSATGGGATRARTQEVLAEARALAAVVAHPHAQGLAAYAEAVAAFLEGRFAEAERAAGEAEGIFTERCSNVAWELASARVFGLWARIYQGGLAGLPRVVERHLAQAQERGDHYAEVNLQSGLANLRWLVDGEPDRARAALREAMGGWSQRGFHLQHYYELIAHAAIDLYQGQGAEAHARVSGRWKELEESLLLLVQFVKIDAFALRGRAALAAACVLPGRRAELLGEVERAAQVVRGEGQAWGEALAGLLAAGLKAASGATAAAAALHGEAAQAARAAGLLHYARAAEWRQGEYAGDPALRAASRAWFEGQGVRQPEKLVSVLAPA